MKKSILFPSATLCVALVTFFLRKNQLAQAKDLETQIYQANAPETIVLTAVLLIFAVVLGLFLLSGGRELPNYTYAVYCPNPMFMATVVTGSFFFLLSILVGFMDLRRDYDAHLLLLRQGLESSFDLPILSLITMTLVVLVGLVMMFLGKQAYRGEELDYHWLTTLPAYLSTARLMSIYRSYGAMTNIQDSFYPIVGAILLSMALYHLCATAYLAPRPRLIVFFSLLSVVFTAVNLASGMILYDIMLALGFNLYMLAFSAALLENTYTSREKYRTPPVPVTIVKMEE